MILQRLTDAVIGYVKFEAEGVDCARLVSRAANRGIAVTDVRVSGIRMTGNVSCRQYKELGREAVRLGIRMRIKKKIAMKLDEGDGIVDVQVCTENDDVLLTTAAGQCIRFPVTDVRVFKGRDSVGVRGIALGESDTVISLSILRHFEAAPAERDAYLKRSRAVAGETEEAGEADIEDSGDLVADLGEELGTERYAEMGAAEQFILTVSERGFGKRTSSFSYRTTGRGGKGITAMAVNDRNGRLVASFPVEESDQLMLVTDGGQLIRVPVDGIRIAGRATQGVIVFNTGEDARVVSVERVSEDEEGEGEAEGTEG